jgi:hypothetical protein
MDKLTTEVVYQLLKWMEFTRDLADLEQCDIKVN